MFVGVVVENFHRCREEQEKEEKIIRAAKRALQMEKKRRRKYSQQTILAAETLIELIQYSLLIKRYSKSNVTSTLQHVC